MTRQPTPPADWHPEAAEEYSQLLGLYLGDGCLIQGSRNGWRMELYLDAAYPRIIDEARAAMREVLPASAVNVQGRPGAVRLVVSSPVLPQAFPQHGPGRKHERPIRLTDWQRRISEEHPRALLRGLIHSDGCRTINRFETRLPSGRVAEYAYTRYFFTNYSADIRRIFCEHCEMIGVRWSQPNERNISISNRESVALLDSFIGPKR